MNKLALALLASAVLPFAASANEPAKAPVKKEAPVAAAAAPVAAPAAVTPAAPTAAVPAAAVAEVAVKNTELKDGTKISVKGEEVFVIGADGKETPAPDAVHELKDGSKLETKGGKVVVKK